MRIITPWLCIAINWTVEPELHVHRLSSHWLSISVGIIYIDIVDVHGVEYI